MDNTTDAAATTVGTAFTIGFVLVFLIVLGTSIWVYTDAKSIGVKKGQLKGVSDMGPLGWFVASLGLWIIGFPMYLANRPQLKRINHKGDPPVVPPVHPPQQEPDFDEQLRKLAKLKAEGLVSEEEFDRKRKQLLGL